MAFFSDALEKIWRASSNERWDCTRECVLPLAGLVDKKGRHLGAVDQSFDLSFLDPLRSDNDFVPQQLFVRQEVKAMFSKLASAHQNRVKKRVLTGSPGIGKSVVFFLAAVQRAASLDKRLIYLRKTEQEDQFISLFVMEKSPNGDSIHVVFGREISMRRNPNLTELVNTTIDGSAIKQEQIGVKEIPVLSGWTEVKIKEAMRGLKIYEPHKKYDLCGGRRLDLLLDTEVKKWFDTVVTSLGPGAIKLAVTSNAATGCTDSSDRLRTRFFHAEGEREKSKNDCGFTMRVQSAEGKA